MTRDTASKTLHRFFEEAFQERVERSPQTLTHLGVKKFQDRLDDFSDAKQAADCELIRDQLERLNQFDEGTLDSENSADRLNIRVFRHEAEQALARIRYRHNDYLISQKFGLHIDFPAFMINMHTVENEQDAHNYLARVGCAEHAFDQVIEGLELRERAGVLPPAYLFPQILGDCRAFIGIEDSLHDVQRNVLYEDFSAKIEKLEGIDHTQRGALRTDLARVLRASVVPAYRRLITFLERQQEKAPLEAGAWSLPDGDAYYRTCLARHTSTDLSADDVCQLGVEEVTRLKQEMLALKDRLGIAGGLQDLYAHARGNPDFYYRQDEQGRQAYLAELQRIIAHVETLLPHQFAVLPQDRLLVKAVERHREKTAGIAFYEGPAPDGSRPGIFYVNLYDLGQLPAFTMEALAYHEALPGHHLQFSIANRLRDLPTFRRYTDDTAYIEGWGLYAEQVAKEMGLYQDPWSEFGRLAQELKRACRLVVDTGLHARRWTRQQAIDYMVENVPSSEAQLVKEVERYLVMPGQATAYKVGMAEILSLRGLAQKAHGEKFEIRAFHDELLRHGPLPLSLLREQIEGRSAA